MTELEYKIEPIMISTNKESKLIGVVDREKKISVFVSSKYINHKPEEEFNRFLREMHDMFDSGYKIMIFDNGAEYTEQDIVDYLNANREYKRSIKRYIDLNKEVVGLIGKPGYGQEDDELEEIVSV